MQRGTKGITSIHSKLLRGGLGIMLLIGVLCLGTGTYFWSKIDRAIEIRNTIHKIRIQMLEARKAEKNVFLNDLTDEEFYENSTTHYQNEHRLSIEKLEQEINHLIDISDNTHIEIYERLQELKDEYQTHFLQLVDLYRQRGFEEWGFEGEWHRTRAEVEGYIERSNNINAVRALLDLKRHEKEYLSRYENQPIDLIYADLQSLKRIVGFQEGAQADELLNALQAYEVAFRNYVVTQDNIGTAEGQGLYGTMQRTVQAIQPLVEEIQAQAAFAGEKARQGFLDALILIWLSGLGLGGIFFYFYARSIAKPIIRLKDAALKIGRGALDTHIEIASSDEVGVLAQAFNQMVRDLGKVQEALRQSEEQSRLVIETASDAFIGMDQDGRITDWNQQASAIFGWSRQDVLGRPFRDLVSRPPSSLAPAVEDAPAIENEVLVFDRRLELSARHSSGREFPIEVAMWPIHTGQSYRINAFVHDITERKQVEAVIRQSEKRFRTLTTHAPVGILLTNPVGDCMFVNGHWCTMAGMDPDKAQGKGWLNAIHPEDRDRIAEVWETSTGIGNEFSSEYRFQTPDGKVTWLYGKAVALRDDADEITGYLGTVIDITERKQADQMKSDFVSFVTHQLRTPLAGIKWLLELASDDTEDSIEIQSYIQDARQSTERLISLVNDLLSISHLERGKLTVAPQLVRLDELTHSVVAELHPLIEAKGHQVSLAQADVVPPLVVDPQLIRQVIMNLVSNAIKYTPPGGDIAIAVRRAGASVCWAIRDSGIGIPREDQQRLFEKFYRAGNVFKVETEGTGLGLCLVRLILEQFRGRVWCQSEEGKGSTFFFTLPLPE